MIYYRNILVVLSVAVFFTGVPNYVYIVHKIVEPLHWVIGFGVLSLPLLIKQLTRTDLLKSPVILWCFGYAWLTLLSFFQSSQSEDVWQEVRWRCLTISSLLMFLAIYANPDSTKLVRRMLVGGVLFGVALNIYELFVPRSFSSVIGRSAGLYGDPNTAGAALVLGMIFSVTALSPRYHVPFILLTGIGVFLTFSRGAILIWLLAVTSLILMGKVRFKDLLLTSSVSLLLIVLILLPRWDEFLMTLERDGVLNKNVMERMAWFADPTGVSDDSSWERKYVAKRAWEKVAERPFLGNGTGSFRNAYVLPHNQYLTFMQDHGLIGAVILPLLGLAVTWGMRGENRRLAIVFNGTLLLWGFFSHTILNEPHTLLLLALMAAMTLTSREDQVRRTLAMATVEVDAPRAAVRM